MSGHTRGPWKTQGWVPTWAYIPVMDASHNLVASLYPDFGHNYTREEVEANARLIAEAPELLATLKHFVHWHDQLSKADIARAEAAIARAEDSHV